MKQAERSRRDVVLGSLGSLAFIVAGCVERKIGASRSAAGPAVPRVPGPPEPTVAPTGPSPPDIYRGDLPFRLVPRTSWASFGTNTKRVRPMNGVRRLTVHHAGLPEPFTETDHQAVAAYVDRIRRSHVIRFRGGDIGYHYVIDAAGVVWEGRPVKYQGAHVRVANPHNVGVMCLGNFDKQTPTEAQVATLTAVLNWLMGRYGVGPSELHTHQELMPTRCPGKALQGRMGSIRRELTGHVA